MRQQIQVFSSTKQLTKEELATTNPTNVLFLNDWVYIKLNCANAPNTITLTIASQNAQSDPIDVHKMYDDIFSFELVQISQVETYSCKLQLSWFDNFHAVDLQICSPVSLQVQQLVVNKQKAFLAFTLRSHAQIIINKLIIQTNTQSIICQQLIERTIPSKSTYSFFIELDQEFFRHLALQIIQNTTFQLENANKTVDEDISAFVHSINIKNDPRQFEFCLNAVQNQHNLQVTLVYNQLKSSLQFMIDLRQLIKENIPKIILFLNPSSKETCPVRVDAQVIDKIPQEHNTLSKSAGYYCAQLIAHNVSNKPITNVQIQFLDYEDKSIAMTKCIKINIIEPNQHASVYTEFYSYADMPVLKYNAIEVDGKVFKCDVTEFL
ncbi:Conserved_hypothetical protein [Hexamita inflata]|uniref:Uncharacterized protein n=1 Tax=Hexamita inflata TaxID=28002 RepID=A0ABP1JNA0_9EUKA